MHEPPTLPRLPRRDCATGDCGREDTDFIVFVTARQTDVCRPTTTAHAVTCIIDRDNAYGLPNRPLAGHVNFCPSAGRGGAAAAEPRSLEAAVDTAVHELLHALYMSAGLYPFFPGGMDGCAPSAAPAAVHVVRIMMAKPSKALRVMRILLMNHSIELRILASST